VSQHSPGGKKMIQITEPAHELCDEHRAERDYVAQLDGSKAAALFERLGITVEGGRSAEPHGRSSLGPHAAGSVPRWATKPILGLPRGWMKRNQNQKSHRMPSPFAQQSIAIG
jgi:hypothetical protein